MSSLSLNTSSKAPKKASKKEVVADSWEDEDLSGSEPEDNAQESASAGANKESHPGTEAPPPTPASPLYPSGQQQWPDYTSSSTLSPGGPAESGPRRPEKTDAVARRMIAAGLGLKAPKQTEEQKAYQKSVREQEKKRREQQREEEHRQKEETEKAKAAVWDD